MVTGQRYWRSYRITFAGTLTGRLAFIVFLVLDSEESNSVFGTGVTKGFGLVGRKPYLLMSCK